MKKLNNYGNESIILGGVLFISYLFTMIAFYFLITPFVNGFFSTWETVEIGDEAADSANSYYTPLLAQAVQIILAFGLATPVVWFIFWVFSRDASIYRRRG